MSSAPKAFVPRRPRPLASSKHKIQCSIFRKRKILPVSWFLLSPQSRLCGDPQVSATGGSQLAPHQGLISNKKILLSIAESRIFLLGRYKSINGFSICASRSICAGAPDMFAAQTRIYIISNGAAIYRFCYRQKYQAAGISTNCRGDSRIARGRYRHRSLRRRRLPQVSEIGYTVVAG